MGLKEEFDAYRAKMNDRILDQNHKVMNRFFSLDNQTYQDGALSSKTKEMLGLVSSLVLRCDDCVKYHLGKCKEMEVTTKEVNEIFARVQQQGFRLSLL